MTTTFQGVREASAVGDDTRLRGAFINTASANCSIHESGLMVYDCIRESDRYLLEYFSLDQFDLKRFARDGVILPKSGGLRKQPVGGFDFWVFNWHFITMAMELDPSTIARLPAPKFTIVLELSPGDPLELVPSDVFDGYIVLDPGVARSGGIFPFPRPLRGKARQPETRQRAAPVIGSFGFGTPGKGFEQLIEAVNTEFERATVRLNVPYGTYATTEVIHNTNYARYLEKVCTQIAKPGIEVRFTFDFMEAESLIDWCGDNDLNCFMYTRCQPGLAATTDQAILSGRPLATLTNDTFRHIHQYIEPYPVISLKEAMETSLSGVYRMQEDWSRAAFNRTFHNMLAEFGFEAAALEGRGVDYAKNTPRSTVLVAYRYADEMRGPLDYATRIADCLGRTRKYKIVRAHCENAAELRDAIVEASATDLIMIDFAEAEPDAFGQAAQSAPGSKLVIADREGLALQDRRWEKSGFETIECRPVVPFYTVSEPAPGALTICLLGFSSDESNLEAMVEKIALETPHAHVRIEVEHSVRAKMEPRVDALRQQFSDSGSPALSLFTLLPAPDDLVRELARMSLIVAFNDPGQSKRIEDIVSIAMATERAVVFTRAAPIHRFADACVYVEDHTIEAAVEMGIAAQIKIRHQFGEWRMYERLSKLIERSNPSKPKVLAADEAMKMSAADLLAFTGATFVKSAYNAVLSRAPSQKELQDELEMLQLGRSKHSLIAKLRLSHEGRARGADFPGLYGLVQRHKSRMSEGFSKLAARWPQLFSKESIPEIELDRAAGASERDDGQNLTGDQCKSLGDLMKAPAHRTRQNVASAFASRPHVFFVIGGSGRDLAVGVFARKLASALAVISRNFKPVIWNQERKAFRCATVSEVDVLGLSRLQLGIDASLSDGVEMWLDADVGAGGWLITPGRELDAPYQEDLVDMDMILEGRRLGMRVASLFHGAELLKEVRYAGAAATTHQDHMRALLLTDLILTFSRVAKDDFVKFAVCYELAEHSPPIRRISAPARVSGDDHGAFLNCARLVRSTLTEVGDPAVRLSHIYFLYTEDHAITENDKVAAERARLADAFAEAGVLVRAVWWSPSQRILKPLDGKEMREGGWLISYGPPPPHLLQAIREWRSDIRVSVILPEAAFLADAVDQNALLDGVAEADKAFLATPDIYDALLRRILQQRRKALCAADRYCRLDAPDIFDGAPRVRHPKPAHQGALRLLLLLSGNSARDGKVLSVCADAVENYGLNISLSVVGGGSGSAETALSRLLAAGVTVRQVLADTQADLLALADEVDYAVLADAAPQRLLRAFLWRATPCLVHSASTSASPNIAPGMLTVDMDDDAALTDGVLRLADDQFRQALSREAIDRPVRDWLCYACDILKALADKRFMEALPPVVDATLFYERFANLQPRPKLSVCISTYNRANYLATSLSNIFAQIPEPLEGLEILVVDNTSTDDTSERITPYLGRPDFRYLKNKKNVGMLGNLAISAQRARGEHIWILGDDDLTRAGVIERILGILKERPRLPLIYLNYGYTSEEDPESIPDLANFLDAYNVLEPPGPDMEAPVKMLAAKCENFFNAIYSHIYRRDHALLAYCQDTSGRKFSRMRACVPTAYYVLNHMMDLPAYWVGEPALVVNSRVSWAAYGPMVDLEHLPRSWDLAEAGGCPAAEVDQRRANRLWLVKMMWRDLFENDEVGNAEYLSPLKIFLRINYLPQMSEHISEFRDIYERAHANAVRGAEMPPSVLFSGYE